MIRLLFITSCLFLFSNFIIGQTTLVLENGTVGSDVSGIHTVNISNGDSYKFKLEVWGAGGGTKGGGSADPRNGGGGGGYSRIVLNNVTETITFNYTAGGSFDGDNGNASSITYTYGSTSGTITANGGTFGDKNNYGVGGDASGGSVNTTGGNGGSHGGNDGGGGGGSSANNGGDGDNGDNGQTAANGGTGGAGGENSNAGISGDGGDGGDNTTAGTNGKNPGGGAGGKGDNKSGGVKHGGLGRVKITQVSVTLPLEIIDFKVKSLSNANIIFWDVISALSCDFFIEKSIDSENFQEIGNIKNKNNKIKVNSYSFIDSESYNGVVYYRLRIEDLNGLTKYSNIVSVRNISQENFVTIYPTILKNSDRLNVVLNSKSKKVDIYIYDIKGREILRFSDNQQKLNIDFSDFNPGLYVLKIISSGNFYTKKFLIVN